MIHEESKNENINPGEKEVSANESIPKVTYIKELYVLYKEFQIHIIGSKYFPKKSKFILGE